MSSFQDRISMLKGVDFQASLSVVPSWQSRGIPHGFVGMDYEGQDFHHGTQVHGINIFEASEDSSSESSLRPQGDGLFTKNRSIKIAIKTADCLPILLYSPDMVMAVHAGWRGLFSGILNQALSKFPKKADVLLSIGPHISRQSFEVGPELIDELQKCGLNDHDWPWLISPGIGDRWFLDLSLCAVMQALSFGLGPNQISCQRGCTKIEAERWHSFRRDGEKSGRNWSWIERP